MPRLCQGGLDKCCPSEKYFWGKRRMFSHPIQTAISSAGAVPNSESCSGVQLGAARWTLKMGRFVCAAPFVCFCSGFFTEGKQGNEEGRASEAALTLALFSGAFATKLAAANGKYELLVMGYFVAKMGFNPDRVGRGKTETQGSAWRNPGLKEAIPLGLELAGGSSPLPNSSRPAVVGCFGKKDTAGAPNPTREGACAPRKRGK
jgi:hypothetical protein